MTDEGGYHDDVYEAERNWRRDTGDVLVSVATALIAVGAMGSAGWLWAALRTQGALGDAATSSLAAGTRVDLFVSTLDQLVLAVLGISIGVALRRHAQGPTV